MVFFCMCMISLTGWLTAGPFPVCKALGCVIAACVPDRVLQEKKKSDECREPTKQYISFSFFVPLLTSVSTEMPLAASQPEERTGCQRGCFTDFLHSASLAKIRWIFCCVGKIIGGAFEARCRNWKSGGEKCPSTTKHFSFFSCNLLKMSDEESVLSVSC